MYSMSIVNLFVWSLINYYFYYLIYVHCFSYDPTQHYPLLTYPIVTYVYLLYLPDLTALYTCSVCHYRYRTERTLLAAALLHDNGAIAITILLLLLGVFITGGTIQWFMTWLKCDLAGEYSQ